MDVIIWIDWYRYFFIIILAKEVGFKRYKIASRTLKDNPELVKEIISEEKQTIISLGMWDEDHPPFLENDNIKYLWCKSKYPASPWDLVGLKCLQIVISLVIVIIQLIEIPFLLYQEGSNN